MTKQTKLILIGGGVPLLIAVITAILWLATNTFPDKNSKLFAALLIGGGVLAGLLIFGAALLQKIDDYIDRNIAKIKNEM